MQDIRERVAKKYPNAIYFEVRATVLRPRLHTKGFQLSTIGSFTQGPPLRKYNSTLEYTTPYLYTITSTQEGRHKD